MTAAANVSPPIPHRGFDRLLRRLDPFNRSGDGTADHAFACRGGKTYSKPEADRALALTVEFFKQHLGGEHR